MTSTAAGPAPILVVDDDDSVRALTRLTLRRAGFDVIEAQTGQAALDIVQTELVSLIILDIVLPGMSGIDVVRALRSRPDTATLPVLLITGSGDADSVIEGLGAGADDFVRKPIRQDELVARVNARLRSQALWSHAVEHELRARASVVAALGHLAISSDPEEAAEAVVRELATRTDSDFVAVLQLGTGGELHELATFDRSAGVQRGGHALAPSIARTVLGHAREGPWIEDFTSHGSANWTVAFQSAAPQVAVGAPIYAGDDLVGLLTIGIGREAAQASRLWRAKLLAAAIDYAAVLSSLAGQALAVRRDVAATRARLRHILTARRYHPVYQPIVELESGATVGYEALTRFDDGTRPELRFAEAEEIGIGPEFELATMQTALDGAGHLPGDGFLAVNVSPGLLLSNDRQFRKIITEAERPIVLELTEHAPINDYRLVQKALARLGDIGISVDDAGAGYASLRHILELRPTFAKLDISLVSGIDGDDLRQALAAGLQYFASNTGCRLIAEGVERPAEADVLRRLGVELGQGHLFGRPEPAP